MQIKHSFLQLEYTYPLHEPFQKEEILFFDIETTGFSPNTSYVYLIGCVYYKEGSWQITQWLNAEPLKEAELLLAFAAFLKDYRRVIHYNGSGFDIPFLQKKAALYGIPDPFSHTEGLDLYKLILPLKKLLSFESLRLKAIEGYLSLRRQDTFSGEELISVYSSYIGRLTYEKLMNQRSGKYETCNPVSIDSENGNPTGSRNENNSSTDSGSENNSPAAGGSESNSLTDSESENNSPAASGGENNSPAAGGSENNSLTDRGSENNSPAASGSESNSLTDSGSKNSNSIVSETKKSLPSARELEDTLLLHNYEDIKNLPSIATMLYYRDIFEEHTFADTALPVSCDWQEDNSFLLLTYQLPVTFPAGFTVSCPLKEKKSLKHSQETIEGMELSAVFKDNTLCFKLPVYKGTLKYYLSPPSDYYYLPLEDMAVHKSVAQYVDKEFRQKASLSTCYLKKEGLFLPQGEAQEEPYFKKNYGDKITYMEAGQLKEMTAKELAVFGRRLLVLIKNYYHF